ncbi:MAG: 4Fe-4S dicluster domain-containing protein, partial [Gemmatimonadetes bacterium]|nr:4Fe-4S dicluster domain-containing protein [Gemmatimonadota bacterium]
ANADEWIATRPGSEMFLALGMARAIVESGWARVPARELADLLAPYSPELVEERTEVPAQDIVRLAREFASAEASLALPAGTANGHRNATSANVAVNILNYVAGNVGKTVRFGLGPARGRTSSFREIGEFTEALKRGVVELLLIHDVNPAHTLPTELGFEAALEKVPLVVSFATVLDETAAKAHLVLPDHHSLEAWGDHHTRPGVYGLQQPVMSPVFQTKATADVLLSVTKKLGGVVAARFAWPDFHMVLRDRWREIARRVDPGRDFEAFWADALRRGGTWTDVRAANVRLNPEELRKVTFEPPAFDGEREGSFTLVAYPHPYLYDGRGANRPWLQELPDPMTRVAWNAWAEIHPEAARHLGIRTGDVVRIESPAGSIELPAYVYRGVRADTVAIPIGQGHTNFGRYATNRSATPLALLPAARDEVSGARAWLVTKVRVGRTGARRPLPILQGADEDFGREIAEIICVADAREAEDHARRDVEQHPEALAEAAEDADPKSPYRWGMAIDLSSCIGCNACVVACSLENNVPTVGEEQCLKRREMSWIRIDRYFEGGENGAFQTVHLPMLCQHCGNAPCEPVCPVFATYHNPEGLNVQVYNRCVGTRYCSNNCPYKVRRFNWFEVEPEFPFPLNLLLNPDVTVRDKGVMEKCTFCVQRINAAKNQARADGRFVRDGEIVPACAQTCPTEAIVFGNLRDPNSKVSQLARGGRRYHVLEELNTRPAITYLKEVTHNEAVAKASATHARHGGGRSASPLPSPAPRPPQRAAQSEG